MLSPDVKGVAGRGVKQQSREAEKHAQLWVYGKREMFMLRRHFIRPD